jgi:hypothetical protein
LDAHRCTAAGDVFSKIRMEALQACGGVQDRDRLPIGEEMKKRVGEDSSGDDGKRRKKFEDKLPLGVYEAHRAIVHCRLSHYYIFIK